MRKKRCSVCRVPKVETAFAYRSKEQGTRSSICRVCHQSYASMHYRKNKAKYVDRAKRSTPIYRAEVRQKAFEYLTKHPCVDCGEDDVVVLDFDHRDPKAKSHNVSEMLTKGWSWEKVLEEIAKCDVRCANCHRRRTAKQRGFFKSCPANPNGRGTRLKPVV